MAEPEARVSYEFHGFRLDPQQRLLSGADGQPIALPPKVFETLLYFVERRGELLEKATLLKTLWPNVVVEENSLNQNISALRRILGESPGEHRFIVTEPGRGYRFVAAVKTVVAPGPSSSAPTSTASPSATTAAISSSPASRNSIAVLPFANLTGDPAKEYFSDGMAEELIYALARVPGLHVPSRTSSFAYKARNLDLRQIATDLHVGVVLEGSVRSAGERIRVTAQLIDAQSGYHLWAQTYDRKFDDLFALQDELAREIVRALRASLSGEAQGALPQAPPTHDVEAYNLYLQAVALFQAVQFPQAVELLQRALARDPHFARALALLASMRAQAFAVEISLPGTLAETQRDIELAMALGPDDFGPHAALGVLCCAQARWLEADAAFRNALARDTTGEPLLRSPWATYFTQSVGRIEQSLSQLLEIYRLAPAWLVNLMSVAATYQFLGRYAEGRQFMDLAIKLGLPRNFLFMSDAFAMEALHGGRHAEAAKHLVAALTPPLRDAGGEAAIESAFAALAGRDGYKSAIENLNQLRARVGAINLTTLSFRRFTLWYTLLGGLTEAYEVANQSLDTFARHGTVGTAWGFIWMREMLPFRQDPRFQDFAKRLRLFDYWNKYGPPDNCELKDGRIVCH
ncbi:MAG TPA: winged helix-turn-helix domain-containing protein [Steroidobacteraceae bacterium]|nr:winged helix-turn-helix domain-containing protein [Steroidobacteraceae bacterium]